MPTNPDEKKISVSIVTFNSDIALLETAIFSILTELERISIEFHDALALDTVIIFDNNSHPSYQSKLTSMIEKLKDNTSSASIKLVINKRNIGFGRGHNDAIALSNSAYHLIFNPDARLLPNSLASPLKIIQEEAIKIVAPKVLNENNEQLKLHFKEITLFDIFLRSISPNFFKKLFKNRLRNIYKVPTNKPIKQHSNVVFSGCAMLVDVQAFNQVAGFDNRYFLYFEDYDLSLKLLQIGSGFIDESFQIIHSGGFTSKKNLSHWCLFICSAFKFWWKKRLK